MYNNINVHEYGRNVIYLSTSMRGLHTTTTNLFSSFECETCT